MGIVLFLLGGAIGGTFAGPRQGVFGGVAIAGIIWFFLTVIAVTQGGNILLAFSGAREVAYNDAPQLYNIVEEMKIAAALPAVPKVYIIESRAPNAFAVSSGKDTAVAVTTGLLSILSRDELQGVIAHEIGHIKNQDTRFMAIAGVMLGTIVILADMFTRSLFYGQMFGSGGRRSRSNSRDGGNQLQLILFVIAILLAIIAPLLAQILYFACSRSREYLADASAAIFTRLPEGLASALEKISSSSIPLEAANRVTAPMYIVNPLAAKGSSSFSLFSTHPPTQERIKILRSMAGGASISEYNRAFREMTGKNILDPKSLMRSPEEQKLRGIKTEEMDNASYRRKTRDAMDILHRINNFLFIPCPCGLNIKVPPTFSGNSFKCPKCGKIHEVKK